MKKIKYILIIFLTSLTIVALIFFFSDINTKKNINIKQRIFDNNLILSDILLNEKYSEIKIYNNNIYLLRKKDNTIFKFYPSEKKLKKEYQLNKNITLGSFYIDKKKMFAKDYSSNRLIISNKDTVVYSKNFNTPISRLSMINSNLALLTTWDEKNYKPMFYKFNIKDNLLEEISINPKFYNKLKYPGLELDGMIISNKKFTYIIPYGQKIVFVFNENLDFIKSFDLNFKLNNLDIKEFDNQYLIDPNNIYPNFSATVDENYIYILTNKTGKSEDRKDYFIDMYSVQNNKYEKSLKIMNTEDNLPKEIGVNENKIYVLSEKSLTSYGKNKL